MCKEVGHPRPDGDFELVIQDVLTLHGSRFKDAALIVASPPCQKYSYMAMPWTRAKALAKWYRDPEAATERIAELTALFDACFRIQREAREASGRFIPMVVENVRGAQPWVGPAAWSYGSFYLWGDVPALMPFRVGGIKVPGINWSGSDKPGYVAKGFNVEASKRRTNVGNGVRFTTRDCGIEGIKQGGDWFSVPGSISATTGSKSPARKAASAQIAKIPLALSRHIGRTYYEERAA